MPIQQTGDLVSDRLLNAIAQAESGGNPRLVGDQSLSNKAYGQFQLRLPAYQEVVNHRPHLAGIPFAHVATDPQLNRIFAREYLGVLQQHYGMNSLDRLIASYNAGPTAIRKGQTPGSTKAYVAKVKQYLAQQPP